MSLLIAAALVVNGAPVSAFADSPEGNAKESPVSEPKMRFIQTGFSDTGVLTMALQVKADSVQAGETTDKGKVSTRTVSEGVFVFQTDAATVIPITRPSNGTEPQEIICDSSRVAVVGSTTSAPVLGDFIYSKDNENGRGQLIAEGFNKSMGTHLYNANGDFDEQYTGFLTAAPTADSGNAKKLDCYFQYYFNWSMFPKADAEGYITIANFDFQCYSGKENNAPKKATSEDALYCESITVPQTAEDAQPIIDRFYTSTKAYNPGTGEVEETKTGSLAMGAFGYVDKYKVEGSNKPYTGNAYYYFNRPQSTAWRTTIWDTASALSDDPPVRHYAHEDDKYVVKGFSAYETNTYDTDTGAGSDYDFRVPVAEQVDKVPRYQIPTLTETEQKEKDNDWVPTAYKTDGRKVRLSYYLSTTVSDNSATSPETDAETGFSAFLDNIEWKFTLDGKFNGGAPLNDFWENGQLELDSGSGEVITSASGEKLRVKKAKITDASSYYKDCKVQVVYKVTDENNPSTDVYWMVTPIGVTLDMDSETKITYYDKFHDNGNGTFGTEKTTKGKAPQLHITNEAADPESYLWKANQDLLTGQVCLRAVFDPAGAAYEGSVIETRLFTDREQPASTDIKMKDKKPDGTEEDSFEAGVDVDPSGSDFRNDVFSKGVSLESYVYNQYGFQLKEKAQVTIEPDAATKDALTKAGKDTEPFVISQPQPVDEDDVVNEHEYIIKYKDGKDVSSIVGGTYIIKATYDGLTPAEKPISVERAEAKLSYLETSLEHTVLSEEQQGAEEISLTLKVLPLDKDNANVSVTERISVVELANQWRIPKDTEQTLSDYDILPNLRKDGLIDLNEVSKTRARVSFEVSNVSYPVDGGVATDRIPGLDISNISKGEFTYTTETPKDAKFDVTVKASYNGVEKTQTYHFTFSRDPSKLKRIAAKVNVSSVTVPPKVDGAKTIPVTLTPYDQYNRKLSWTEVPTLEGTVDDWGLFFDGKQPVGVSLTGYGHMNISVSPSAEDNSTITVYGKYGNVESARLTINVEREEKRPAKVDKLIYGGMPVVPGFKNVTVPQTVTPTLIVLDQYDEEMEAAEYDTKWVARKSVDTDLVEVDHDTGVLTVQPCAPSCTVGLTLNLYKKGESDPLVTYQYNDIQVERAVVTASDVTVVTESVQYPDLNSKRSFLLSASGSTPYGDAEVLSSEKLVWTLVSVTLQNGTVVTANKNTAGIVTLTEKGSLSFAVASEANDIPKAVTVKVNYNGSEDASATSPETAVEVKKADSVPTSIYILPTDYTSGVEVPHAGDPAKTFTLKGYVKDQFGAIMPDKKVTFKPKAALPSGISFSGTTLSVAHTALAGTVNSAKSVEFEVSYEKLEPVTVGVNVSRGPVEIGSVLVTGIKKSGAQQPLPDFTIDLPSALEDGDSYNLQYQVENQYSDVISSPVSWEITGTTGGVTASIVKATGRLTVTYNDTARDNGGGTIEVTATSDVDTTKKKTQTITVRKAAAVPSYAVPVLQDPGTVDSENGLPKVPKRGEPNNVLTYTAKVYSQYHEEMPNERADLKLMNNSKGVTFTVLPEEDGQPPKNTGKLEVASNVSALLMVIRATPHNKSDAIIEGTSEITTNLSGGIRYVYELVLDPINNYEPNVPRWRTDSAGTKPAEPTIVEYTLKAEIRDQYGKQMIMVDNTYPIWQFVGDHEGVEFAETMRVASDGTTSGENLTLKISSLAVKPSETEKKIQMKVWTNNRPLDDEYFWKSVTITLKRGASRQSFLYFEGSDEDGHLEEPLKRPTIAEKEAVWTVKPVIYDQYGFEMPQAAVNVDMDIQAAEDQSALVEKIYRRGESEQAGNEPCGYKLYRFTTSSGGGTGEKTLMAEFDRDSGELKLYTACTLEELAFTASCPALSIGGTKKLFVPVATDARVPTSAEIRRGHVGPYTIGKGGEGAEDLSENVSVVVYDQYGDAYQGVLKYYWSLHVKDEDGNLNPYDTELDEQGNPKPFENDFLVLLESDSAGSSRDCSLTVQQSQFFEEKTVILRCQVRNRAGLPFTPEVNAVSDIAVKEEKRGTGSFAEVNVIFEAGSFGKLVGADRQSLPYGGVLSSIPGVKTETGYAFLGWTSDGVNLIDPRGIAIYGDTLLVAVYKDITDTRFLDGYHDKTVRPDHLVTRAEFIKMIVAAMGGYDSSQTYPSTFSDVGKGAWYSNYVGFAQAKGFVTGYPDGTFHPGECITRAEAARLLAAAIGLDKEEGIEFSDVEDSAWYAGYVQALKTAGVIDGYSDGTYRPDNLVTRAESAKLIVMITKNAPNVLELENIRKYAYCPFIDVKRELWAYAYIVRAAGIA